MRTIVTSDLHLTDNPRDAHRFDLFPWLARQGSKHDAQHLLILGDLTDKKDHHSAQLVNKICDTLWGLLQNGGFLHITILMGNHDYIDPNTPFFKFLNYSEYEGSGIFFINKIEHRHGLYLPHTRTPEKDWANLNFKDVDYCFLHHTFAGAKSSNGMAMKGTSPGIFKNKDVQFISGDIHVPQKLHNITYVGSPYHVHFGDSYKPRVLLLDGKKTKSLYFKTINKHTIVITDPKELYNCIHLEQGDQVKVRILLHKFQFIDWPNYKTRVTEICKEIGVDLYGVELLEHKKATQNEEDRKQITTEQPNEIFNAFCEQEKIGGVLKEIGEELLGVEE